MTTTRNSKVRGETRELLTALRDLLDTPGGEDRETVRNRAVQAYSVLDALLTIDGATMATSTRLLRKALEDIQTGAQS